MADIDKAADPGFVVPFPTAVVSSSPEGVRTVVVRIGPSAPVLKTVERAVSSGGAPGGKVQMSDLETRLRSVETEVTAIKVKLEHMPTTLQMWAAVAAVSLAVGSGVVGVLWFVIQKTFETYLKGA